MIVQLMGWRITALLVLSIGCGRSATADWDHEPPSCGMDLLPPPEPPPECPAPTQARVGNCELLVQSQTGTCVAGYHLEQNDRDPLCVQNRSPNDNPPRAPEDLKSFLRETEWRCESRDQDPLTGIEQLRFALRQYEHPIAWAALARCHETLEQNHEALVAWRNVLQSARWLHESELKTERWAAVRRLATERIAKFEGQMALLRLELPPAVPGLRVALDRAPYAPAAFSREFELSAGDHELVVTAPGFWPWITRTRLPPRQMTPLSATLKPMHETDADVGTHAGALSP